MLEKKSVIVLLPLLILIFNLNLTYQLWQEEREDAYDELRAEFDFRVRESDARIEERLKAYEQILRGFRSLVMLEGEGVTQGRFQRFVDSLHLADHYPGIYSFGFLPSASTNIAAPGVLLATLAQTSKIPGGVDLHLDPVRRAAMEKARDSGHAVISGKLLLPVEQNEDVRLQSGFVLFLPVYDDGSYQTVADRRAHLSGWAYASFRMLDLMQNILGEVATEIDIEIHDGGKVTPETLMYDPDLSGIEGNSSATFKNTHHLQVSQHLWTVVMRSMYGFEARLDTKKPNVVATVGLIASIFFSLIIWLLLYTRAQAMNSARLIDRELTERKRAEEWLRLSATVVNTVEEAVIVTDPDNNIIMTNPAFTAITGYQSAEVTGQNPRILASGRHGKEFYREMWTKLLSSGSWHGEIWDKRKNGEVYVKWLSVRLVRDQSGHITNHIGVFSDISERKAAEEKIKHLAYFDALTGLPNRTLFDDRLAQVLSRARRESGHFSLLFIDLDKFKPVNDMLGHATGDLVLQEVASRLQGCIRTSDTASRLGGDEFIVLLPDVRKEQDAMEVGEKILRELGRPIDLAGQDLQLAVSIGVAIYPQHGKDVLALINHADAAMYAAKLEGGNRVKIYRGAEFT